MLYQRRCCSRRWPAALLLVGLVAPLTISVAQTVDNSSSGNIGFLDERIEEIVVTARKMEEFGQEVPVAIKVLSAEEMRKQGFDTISDTALLVAGLTYDTGAFVQDTRPAMRGMQNERGRPSVAILVDYVDASTANLSIPGGSSALYSRLLDVERLEVVKGPQTLLYGRNAFGGAINVVTRRPSFEWQSRVGFEAGNAGRQTIDAGISGPIMNDTLAFRASAAKHDFDGFYSNPNTGGALGSEESLAGSLALLWTPSDRLKVYGRFQYSDEDYSEPASALVTWSDRLPVPGASFSAGPPGSPTMPCPDDLSLAPTPVATACSRGVVLGELFAEESDIDYSADPQTGEAFAGLEQTQQFGTMQIDYEVANGTLTYLGGFMDNASNDRSDTDYTDYAVTAPFAFSTSTINILDFEFQHQSHELRHVGEANRLRWIVGGTAYFETAKLSNGSQFWVRNPDSLLAGPPFNLANGPNPGAKAANPQRRETDHYSAFLSLSYALNDRWRVSAEGRYSVDDIVYTVPTWSRQQVSLQQQVPLDFCPPETDDRAVPQSQKYPNVAYDCSVSGSIDSDVFTPGVVLEYQPDSSALYYASITTGFKPGGFAANEAVTLEGQRYDEERVTTFEAGAKMDWLENRLRLNTAVYFNDYRDQQIGIQQQPAGSVTPIPGITNAARVEVFGVELDALWQVNENVTLSAGYAFTDAVFEEFIQGEEGSTNLNKAEAGNIDADFSGNRIGKNPRHALNATIDYRQQLGVNLDGFMSATAIYRSKRYMDESNLNFLPSFSRLNLVGGIQSERYQLMLYVDNVFDDNKITNGQRVVDLGNPDGFAPGRAYLVHMPLPRSYGVRLSAQF